ncbi:glycosyltransferase [Variovorax sp. RHLX14]|uniref:glycosyltransferase family 2 protein n=1 Tax=Variovorax sp. RHLX14 TaxID=1259731 RepID=UPI003F487296
MPSATVVSVALCTYKGESYLGAQLDSILAQSRLPQEIVVFDDVSPDGTWALLESYAPRIRATGIRLELHQNARNLGYVGNFGQALQATTGEIVFLCDQDDVWHPTKIERFLPEFERRPDLMMLHSDARLVDGSGKDIHCGLFEALEVTREELEAIHAGRAFEVLVRRNMVTGATMAVRRKVFERAPVVPAGWIHDEWLAMIATFIGTIDCLEAPSIDYRQHASNQVGARRRGFVERLTGGGMSRLEFMTRTLLRTQTLLDIAEAGPLRLRETDLQMLRDRLTHARFRATPPLRWPARLAAIAREYASGRYSQFSNGPRSALSDFLLLRK